MFECRTNGFGTHNIDQTDLITSSKEVIKNKIVGKDITVDNFLESNPCDLRHGQNCFYSSIVTDRNILLIDCKDNARRSENILKWGKIPFLGKDDYYYEESQPPNLNIKLMLPTHESGLLSDRIVKSLQSTLQSMKFDKVHICCTCKLNFHNIENIVSNKGNPFTVFQKVKMKFVLYLKLA